MLVGLCMQSSYASCLSPIMSALTQQISPFAQIKKRVREGTFRKMNGQGTAGSQVLGVKVESVFE